MKMTFNPNDLNQFTGSEHWYRHPINRKFLYTDGVQYVVETAGAYWLIDEIALIQPYNKKIAAEEFQVWKLTVNADSSAQLTCEDGNDNAVYSKRIPFTDFPAEGIRFFYCNNTLMLPGEY